ncbi:phosphoribosyltransferase family protein [Kocuria rhizophila]|nr:phosphoribosyltransferase family protein [Kocuria rhizophila]
MAIPLLSGCVRSVVTWTTSPSCPGHRARARGRAVGRAPGRCAARVRAQDPGHHRAQQAVSKEVVGDVAGRTCVLIDDMIDTGGTSSGAVQVLEDQGARRDHRRDPRRVLRPAVERLSTCRAAGGGRHRHPARAARAPVREPPRCLDRAGSPRHPGGLPRTVRSRASSTATPETPNRSSRPGTWRPPTSQDEGGSLACRPGCGGGVG